MPFGAIHLTSAFQLAGFRHVIGTLWEIDDLYAAHIATTFFDRLTDDHGQLDTSRAAHALHSTIRDLRHQLPLAPYGRPISMPARDPFPKT